MPQKREGGRLSHGVGGPWMDGGRLQGPGRAAGGSALRTSGVQRAAALRCRAAVQRDVHRPEGPAGRQMKRVPQKSEK